LVGVVGLSVTTL